MRSVKRLLTVMIFAALCSAQTIGNHKAVYDAHGTLVPWTSWQDALDREMKWYLNCPIENSYPRFVWMTFMDGDYKPIQRQPDFIPATQLGMGIISYLKYYAYSRKENPKVLEFARSSAGLDRRQTDFEPRERRRTLGAIFRGPPGTRRPDCMGAFEPGALFDREEASHGR